MIYANTKIIGDLGEDIVCAALCKKGFRIIDRNFRKKSGEIDIVAEKDLTTHFIEVKTVTKSHGSFRPEENVHALKLRRLRRTVVSYLAEKGKGTEAVFKFHVASVVVDAHSRKSRIYWLNNVIL